MPWCETCSRFWTPTSMTPDGACPTCGKQIATLQEPPRSGVPWHFKLLVGVMVVYLGWRAIQLVGWLF